MPTSDEDLQQKAEEVQSLREQVATAEADRVRQEAGLANDATMAQLEAEEAALRARLAVMKQAAEPTVPQAVLDQREAAVAQQQAVEEAVQDGENQSEEDGN